MRAAVDVLRGAGLTCEDVSIPWHLHGARVWDVIATEGATFQMVDANGYGMNWKGGYDPEVIELYGEPVARVTGASSPRRSSWCCWPAGTPSTPTTASTTPWPATSLSS